MLLNTNKIIEVLWVMQLGIIYRPVNLYIVICDILWLNERTNKMCCIQVTFSKEHAKASTNWMYTLFLILWKRCSQPCQSDLQLNRLGYLVEPVSYLLLQGGIATHSKGFPDYTIQNNSSVGAAIILTEWGRPNRTAMMQYCKEVYAMGKSKDARK